MNISVDCAIAAFGPMQYFYMQNLYDTNFDAPDAHFDYSSLFSDAQVEKVGNPEKKCEN
jgi:hypothetical protein